MRKTGFSLCSLLLVLTMLVNMLPVGVIAQEIQKIEATDTVTQVTAPTVTAGGTRGRFSCHIILDKDLLKR